MKKNIESTIYFHIMLVFRRLFLGLLCFFLFSGSVSSQNDDLEIYRQMLENYFQDNENANETDVQTFLESIQEIMAHPYNLNTVGREDLSNLRLLSDLQVENLLTYRTSFGDFLSVLELQAVPGFDDDDVNRILPLVEVRENLSGQNEKLLKMLSTGQNEALLRWTPNSVADFQDNFLGSKDAFGFRFRHTYTNQLRFGLTAEKDAGEEFFKGSNKTGFDFYSAHFFLQNYGKRIKALALGDFSARFGQGLLMQSGFSPGKSAQSVTLLRGGRKISPYASFGEAFFLRGGGLTLDLGKKWETTVLLSSRRRDANVQFLLDTLTSDLNEEGVGFSAIQASGLHRTQSEIDDEKKINETVAAASLTRKSKYGTASVNLMNIHYDKDLQANPAPYRRYSFTGNNLLAGSFDYSYFHRNWIAFGETAMSDNGKIATVNSVNFAADRRVMLVASVRYFDKAYQFVYANPFGEFNGAANEQGFYVGAEIKPINNWVINAYTDTWKSPWLRFGVDAPSVGHGYLGRVTYTRRKKMSAYLQFQTETKEQNVSGEVLDFLQDKTIARTRLHAEYKVSKSISLNSRAEFSRFKVDEQPSTSGYMAYQDITFKKFGTPLSFTARYAIYDTEDSNTRIYSFERDLFSAISVPSFAGRGSRFYINMSYNYHKFLILEARYGRTMQQWAYSEEGFTGIRDDVRLQVRVKF